MTKGAEMRQLLKRLPDDQKTFSAIATRGGWKKRSGSSVQRYFSDEFDHAPHPAVADKLLKALAGYGNPPVTENEVREILYGKKDEISKPDGATLKSSSSSSGMATTTKAGDEEDMKSSTLYRSAVEVLKRLPVEERLDAYLESLEDSIEPSGVDAAQSP